MAATRKLQLRIIPNSNGSGMQTAAQQLFLYSFLTFLYTFLSFLYDFSAQSPPHLTFNHQNLDRLQLFELSPLCATPSF